METGKWYEAIIQGNIPTPRSRHSMTKISNKELLLLGGRDKYLNNCQEVYILHTDEMKWQLLSKSNSLFEVKREGLRVINLYNKGIIVGGGKIGNHVSSFYFVEIDYLRSLV